MPEHTDHEALLLIQEVLDGTAWNETMLNEIAAILTNAGYQVRDKNDKI